MHTLLESLISELKDRKKHGEKTVFVEESSLQALAEALSLSDSDPVNSPASPVADEKTPPQPIVSPEEVARILSSRPEITTPKEQDVHKSTKDSSVSAFPPPPVLTLPEGSKEERYAWLKDRILGCETCKAHVRPGKHIVVGSGNLDSPVFFCGEAPGAEEETLGEVFVGRAGQLLVKIINAMGLQREDVYIGNIMNWRPEMDSTVGNRPPTSDEMGFCLPYLRAQLEIVQPKVIVALGNTAITGLLGPDPKRKMGDVRGTWLSFNDVPLMPTYHPSYILRNGSMRNKRIIWEDMLMVMEKVGMPISDKQRKFFT
ncbi:MAG: uracil-DNA glycosylase [Opitutales bacterium]|nr:uracil-DNA glycosylase [Opitutales bacterium]